MSFDKLSNPGPCWCEVTVLTTTSCPPNASFNFQFIFIPKVENGEVFPTAFYVLYWHLRYCWSALETPGGAIWVCVLEHHKRLVTVRETSQCGWLKAQRKTRLVMGTKNQGWTSVSGGKVLLVVYVDFWPNVLHVCSRHIISHIDTSELTLQSTDMAVHQVASV